MIDVDSIRRSFELRLKNESLLSFLDLGRTKFVDLIDEILVEVVLSDASYEGQVADIFEQWAAEHVVYGKQFRLILRSLWTIDRIGEKEAARAPSGGIAAATLVPVWLKSGSKKTVVSVAVTHLAEIEIGNVTGRDPDLERLAKTYVESLLRRGGKGSWNPLRGNWLEINAEFALELHRVFAKTA